MAKTDLGDKQTCPNCGAKFYDLRKRPAVCPKCTTSFDPSEEGVRVKRGRSRVTTNDYEDDEELEDTKGKKAGDEDEDEESETEATAEIDVEAEAEPLVTDDEEEDTTAKSADELPEGFSEDDETDLGEDADDDSVPLLEDEDELSEEELGEIAGDDGDESDR